jgi:membrane protease YdiL (CAAX protease family)
VEEFFFRGLLLRAGMRRYRFWPVAIVTSALFGLAHVWQVDTARARIILGGTIGMFGLVQCLLARRKARLGPNMFVHGLANAIAVIVAIL